ncbi:MAG: LamG domain-containing protein [Microbacteriaceae bacterium]|nr:LamG domain-containing protein [Microbacteriaceae bacterium]
MTGILLSLLGGKVSAVPDPYFEYTTLLLPGNGTNGAQNNTFLDSSSNNFTITRNGNTTQGNFSPFSQTGWGNYFDGTGDYLSVADNAAFDLGTSDFTIEGWVYVTATSGSQQTLVSKGTGANNQASYHIALDGSTWKYYLSGNGSTWSIASGVSMGASAGLNTWQHIALVRSGSTFTPYVNGVAGTTTTSSASIFDGNKVFSIGADDAAAQFVIGYISNTRVVKGTAVYTSNFTPPTAPLTAISGTSLLTCQSNRFVDNSTNPSQSTETPPYKPSPHSTPLHRGLLRLMVGQGILMGLGII